MWNYIPEISTGTSLAAFIVAAILAGYRSKLKSREKVIQSAPVNKKTEVVQTVLEFFNVDTSRLTQDQAFQIAIIQIQARSRRYTISALVLILLAFVAAATAVIFARNSQNPAALKAEIVQPAADGMTFRQTFPLEFEAKAFDPATGDSAESDYAWQLSDGTSLGTGRKISVNNLPVGRDRIVLTVTTKQGQQTKITRDLVIAASRTKFTHLADLRLDARCQSVAINGTDTAVAIRSDIDHSHDRFALIKFVPGQGLVEVSALPTGPMGFPGPVTFRGADVLAALGTELALLSGFQIGRPHVVARMPVHQELGAILELVLSGDLFAIQGLTGSVEVGHVTREGILNSYAWLLHDGGGQGGLGFGNNSLFIASAFAGFHIFDLQDPRAPVEKSTLPGSMELFSTNIYTRGDFHYVGSSHGILSTIFAANLSSPVITSTLSKTAYSRRVSGFGDRLFIAGGRTGLAAVDLTNPAQPVMDALFNINGYASDVAVGAKYLAYCNDASLSFGEWE